MKLIDMKLPKKTKAELKNEMNVGNELENELEKGPRYPWGLQINFEEDIIKKIPALNKIKGGETGKMEAEFFVKEVSIRDTADKKKRRERIELQITKIGISNKRIEEDEAEESFMEGANEE